MTVLETPYGTFTLSRRAIVGASIVQATRECTHRFKRLSVGDYAVIEHRKLPLFRQHIAMGWARHVATYDMDGNQVELRAPVYNAEKGEAR